VAKLKRIVTVPAVLLITFFIMPLTPAEPAVNDYGFVSSRDGLYLRSAPSTRGEKLMLLQYHTLVIVFGRSDGRERIDGINDYWYMAKVSGKSGYVFGGYIDFIGSNKGSMAARGQEAISRLRISTAFDRFYFYGYTKNYFDCSFSDREIIDSIGRPLASQFTYIAPRMEAWPECSSQVVEFDSVTADFCCAFIKGNGVIHPPTRGSLTSVTAKRNFGSPLPCGVAIGMPKNDFFRLFGLEHLAVLPEGQAPVEPLGTSSTSITTAQNQYYYEYQFKENKSYIGFYWNDVRGTGGNPHGVLIAFDSDELISDITWWYSFAGLV
jgi:hypothetical protein